MRKSHPEMEEQLICLIIPNVLSEEEVQEGQKVGSQEGGEGEAGGGEEKTICFLIRFFPPSDGFGYPASNPR